MSMLSKLAALFSALLFASTAAAARPNIVFIMVDDLDIAVWEKALDLGVLPNIQSELIDKGTTFKQLFATQSLCCPSRATLHTGMYPHNHGVVGNPTYVASLYDNFQRDMEPKALANWLKQTHADGSKYRTGYIGKHLNSSGKDPKYVPGGWDVWQALLPKNKKGGLVTPVQCMYNYALSNTGGTPYTDGVDGNTYQTDKIAELAVKFINDTPLLPNPQPLFLVIAPTAPHTEAGEYTQKLNDQGVLVDVPTNCWGSSEHRVRTSPTYAGGQTPTVTLPVFAALPDSSYNEEDRSDKPGWIKKRPQPDLVALTKLFNDKIAALRPVDDLVKGVVKALKDREQLDSTLIIFTSDNGYQYGTHRLTGKEDAYEESIRLPMVVKTPYQTEKRTQETWVLNNDWAPTIAEYANVPHLLTVDGRSFRSQAESSRAMGARRTMLIRNGFNPATGKNTEPEQAKHLPFLAMRTRDPKLTGNTSTFVYIRTYNLDPVPTPIPAPKEEDLLHGVELYDLATDPNQMESAHGSMSPARAELFKKRVMDLSTCKGKTCRDLENQTP